MGEGIRGWVKEMLKAGTLTKMRVIYGKKKDKLEIGTII
jgi:hypothetical protein